MYLLNDYINENKGGYIFFKHCEFLFELEKIENK